MIVISALPMLLYYPLVEYFFKGKTIGKSFLNLRVAKIDGKPPSLGETTLRWLLRAFDTKVGLLLMLLTTFFDSFSDEESMNAFIGVFMLLPIPIIGILFILLSKKNQRIGDLAADTIVIHEQKRISLEETILQNKAEDYVPVFKQALKLRDKDIYIIKKVVEKAEKELDHSQVIPLAEKAKEILDIETDLLPLPLLNTLLKDYNYLAQQKDLDNE